jgi:hypothetical protein
LECRQDKKTQTCEESNEDFFLVLNSCPRYALESPFLYSHLHFFPKVGMESTSTNALGGVFWRKVEWSYVSKFVLDILSSSENCQKKKETTSLFLNDKIRYYIYINLIRRVLAHARVCGTTSEARSAPKKQVRQYLLLNTCNMLFFIFCSFWAVFRSKVRILKFWRILWWLAKKNCTIVIIELVSVIVILFNTIKILSTLSSFSSLSFNRKERKKNDKNEFLLEMLTLDQNIYFSCSC